MRICSWHLLGGGTLIAAHAAMGIAGEPDFVPPARERVEKHEAAGESLAHAGHELDRLHRLERPHDAHERREHAHDGAAYVLGGRILGEETVIARRVAAAQVE